MRKITKKLAAIGSVLGSFAPFAALAQGGNLDSITNNFNKLGNSSGLETTRDLPTVIGSVINAALGLLGVVLVIIIIYAGYKWMMAQGNAGEVDKAKTMMTQAVIGMIILMAAYAIAQFVLTAVISSTVG